MYRKQPIIENESMKKLFILLLTTFILTPVSSKATSHSDILSMRDRADFIDSITKKRVKTLLPKLMNDTDIDMWVLISREYNEDPIVKTMLPATWISARRTTILVFARVNQTEVKAYAVAPYNVGNVFERAWNKKRQPNQWQALVDIINKHNPKNIALNQSQTWAHADGLVVTDRQNFMASLPKALHNKVISSEPLAIAWLEQRIPEEVTMYKHMVSIAHNIIAEAFSNKVVIAGKTTPDDIVWWLRERVRELKLLTWFHPSVSIQRSDSNKFDHENSFTNTAQSQIIQHGDLLHVDFGISYLRLNTDTQQHAYVLKKGETKAPEYLTKALKQANQLQDVFTALFKKGVTGNSVLKASREEAISQGLKPTIYTHPLGYHGHAAGTTLGMWDSQQGVEGSGDYPLHLNTAYSIELNNAAYISEWKKEIRIMLEEDAFFDDSGVWYLNGRQTELLLIK
jgi:Xaa-Pro aminopeptidase